MLKMDLKEITKKSFSFSHLYRIKKKKLLYLHHKKQNLHRVKNGAVKFNEKENMIAEIAQLVEHDLAKVGVAGSSPVFRSKAARMVESVDTQDLKSCGHCGCVGSSPTSGTLLKGLQCVVSPFFAPFAT